ncbi:MAG TPA: NAD(P)H-quinone oxidoreductase [Gemmatimonadota bacterium]
MKAIVVPNPGGPEQLVLDEVPDPRPGADDVLVRVRAVGVNRADVLQRQGRYPPPPGASPVLGLEIAGVVEGAGPGAGPWSRGDRVFGLLAGGGYAERAALPGTLAMRIPDPLSFEEAAAVPEVFLTAWQTLFWIGRCAAGEAVLIHAGASGVGTAAIQLAREAGADVLVTAGSAEKLERCRELGARVAVNRREGPFTVRVLEETGGRGVDVILDVVGAPYWDANVTCLATDGRLVLIATMGGSTIDGADLRALMRKRLTVAATTLRARSVAYKAELTRQAAAFVLPRLADGRVRAVVDSVFPLEQAPAAHRRMEENRNVGKIVLTVGG